MVCLSKLLTQPMPHEYTPHHYRTTTSLDGALLTTGFHGLIKSVLQLNPTRNPNLLELWVIKPCCKSFMIQLPMVWWQVRWCIQCHGVNNVSWWFFCLHIPWILMNKWLATALSFHQVFFLVHRLMDVKYPCNFNNGIFHLSRILWDAWWSFVNKNES